EQSRTPRSERRLSGALGLTKTQKPAQPKRLKKALHNFVWRLHTERALKLQQPNLPSLPQLRAQIGEEIQGLKLKVDRLKDKQAESEQPSPLRRDSPSAMAVEAVPIPVVGRQVLEQSVQAIHAAPEAGPAQAGGKMLDDKQLAPEQVAM